MPAVVTDVAASTHVKGETVTAVEPHVESRLKTLEALALDVHSEPELAWQEHRSVQKLIAYLTQEGFEVETPFCELETSFRAVFDLGRPGPTVTYMAEYDALPEIGHACGHNLICSAAVGAASALARAAEEAGIGGRVQVIGTPAEEGGGGKVVLLERDAFSGSDVAIMFHPGARTMPIRGALAASRMTMIFHGKSAHASSNPHLGINALDACRLTFNAIDAMRQHLRDETRIHGIITNGGSAPNVVPDRAEAMFIARHKQMDYLQEVKQILMRCARGAAQAVGATVEFDEGFTYAERRNNHQLALRFGGYLQELGEPVKDPPAVGGVGSSDFGNVSQVVPAIHSYIAIVPEGISNHTTEFAAAAASPAGLRAMALAAKAMAMTGFDVLSDPGYLKAVQEEFGSAS